MQREIDKLKKELHHARQRHSSPNSELSSEEIDDATYKQRSRTSASETFSCDEEYHHKRRNKSPPYKGLGNNAMNKALSQVSKSPFTRNIEGATINPHSPFIMVEQIQWSMSVTSIKGWPFIPNMRL